MEFTKQPHDNIPASRAALKLALFAVLVFIIGALQVSLFSKVRLFRRRRIYFWRSFSVSAFLTANAPVPLSAYGRGSFPTRSAVQC